jgi:hypothetical protein
MTEGHDDGFIDLGWLPKDMATAWQFQLTNLGALQAMLTDLARRNCLTSGDGARTQLDGDVMAIQREVQRQVALASSHARSMADLSLAIDRATTGKSATH